MRFNRLNDFSFLAAFDFFIHNPFVIRTIGTFTDNADPAGHGQGTVFINRQSFVTGAGYGEEFIRIHPAVSSAGFV